MRQTRRKFLATTMTGALASATARLVFAEKAISAPMILQRGVIGANDQIRFAILGVNGRGKDHMTRQYRAPFLMPKKI